MSETKVPALGSVSSETLEDVLRAVKITLDVREGRLGDPLDANVTYRDLIGIGALAENPASRGSRSAPPAMPITAFLDGYVPSLDLTPPPAPENFTATGGFALVQLQWDRPAIRNLAYTEIWRSETNVLGNAVQIGTSSTGFYVDSLGTSATRYYWVRFVTQANITGPYNDTTGTAATTATDPGLVLGSLTGQITESQLFTDLSDRIDLIDGPDSLAGSVAYRLAQEAASRSTAITTAITSEASARTTAIAAETSARVAAIAAEATARGNDVFSLQQQINTLSAASSGDFQDLIAVVNQEQIARIDADTALSSNIYTLVTKAGETTSAIQVEQSTRASSDQATATQLTSLIANIGVNQAALVNEQTVRSTADSASASQFTGLTSTVGNVASSLSLEQTSRATADSSISTQVYALVSQAGNTSSALTIEQNTRSDQNLALASQITNLSSALGVNSSTLAVEQTTRATQDLALSYQLTSLTAATGSNAAALAVEQTTRSTETQSLAVQNTSLTSLFGSSAASLVSEQNTRASQDTVVSSLVNGLSSSLGAANAALSQELTTRTTGDTALSSQITNLSASYGTNAAAILAESAARASADSSTANAITTVQARLDTGDFASVKTQSQASADSVLGLQAKYTVTTDVAGHVSGFGLASSANNGTPISRFGVRASEFFIAPPSVSQASAPTTGLYKGFVWYDTSTNTTKYYNPDLPGWTTTPFVLPFVVKTAAETINGVTAPAGVYIDTAFIRSGTITNAMIGNAQIDNAKISGLNADKITAGTIDAARINADAIAANIANIDAAKITSGVLNSARIGDASITSAKIADSIQSSGYTGNLLTSFPLLNNDVGSNVANGQTGTNITNANGAIPGYTSTKFTMAAGATYLRIQPYALADYQWQDAVPGQRFEIQIKTQYQNLTPNLYAVFVRLSPTTGNLEGLSTVLLDSRPAPGGVASTPISQNAAEFVMMAGFATTPATIPAFAGGTVVPNKVILRVEATYQFVTTLVGSGSRDLYLTQPYISPVSAGASTYTTPFSYGYLGWEIRKDGSIFASNLNARGKIAGGSFTSFNWPGGTDTGYYLGPEGLRIGNYSSGRYVSILINGDFYVPGFQVSGGSATFSGNLAAGTATFDSIVSKAATSFEQATLTCNNGVWTLFNFYMDHPGVVTAIASGTWNQSGSDGSYGYYLALDTTSNNTYATGSFYNTGAPNIGVLMLSKYFATAGWKNLYLKLEITTATAAHLGYVTVLRSYR